MEPFKFTEKVRIFFKYLTEQYGFTITSELKSESVDYSGYILYESASCFISVSLEEGFVHVDLGSPADPKRTYHLLEVIEYLDTVVRKELNVPPILEKPREERIIDQLGHHSQLLRDYGQALLSGTFTDWNGLRDYSDNKSRQVERSIPEMVRQVKAEMHGKKQ